MLVAHDVWAQPPGAEHPAVRGVSFELKAGEWLAITGPNGSGKSTLALAAAGLWPVSRGSVEVGGGALEPTAAGRARAGLATVLQEPASQLFERTVGDEIAFAARNLGVPGPELAARVSEWSGRLGLGGVLDRDPHALSAGLQQCVLLAGALASSPRVLVVDEGAAHLDAAARERVLGVVRGQVARGLAVLWVTQDPSECAAADRVLGLGANGRFAADLDDVSPATHSAAPESPERLAAPPSGVVKGALRVRIDPDHKGALRAIQTTRPIEFELAAGRPVAVLGANAAGKTVLLEAIAGVCPCPQVSVEAIEPGANPPILAAQYPELQVFGETVAEELSFGAAGRGGDPAQALEVATQVLAELELGCVILAQSTWGLSTGERRLVQVVAALVTPAAAVLVDEPTCGLDARRSDSLGRILARWARTIPVAVATQDPRLPGLIMASERRLGE